MYKEINMVAYLGKLPRLELAENTLVINVWEDTTIHHYITKSGQLIEVSDTPITAETITVVGPTKVEVGSTVKFSVVTVPVLTDLSELVWTSSDETIAIVDAITNEVRFIKEGRVTIIATVGEAIGETNVTAVLPDSFTIGIETDSKNGFSLVTEGTLQLTASIANESVTINPTWTSLDTNIATVSETGVVTALQKVGVAVIVAEDTTINAKGTVTVTIQKSVLTGFTIKLSEDTVLGTTAVASATTVVPDAASVSKINWRSTEPSVMSVDSEGNVEFLALGTTTLHGLDVASGVVSTLLVEVVKAPTP